MLETFARKRLEQRVHLVWVANTASDDGIRWGRYDESWSAGLELLVQIYSRLEVGISEHVYR